MARCVPLAIFALLTTASCKTMMTESADGRYGPREGENEITFAGALSQTSFEVGSFDTDTTSLTGQVGLGWFLTDHWEVGGQAILSISDPDDGDETRSIGLLPYGRYNWHTNERTWFYAGVQSGYQIFEAGGEDDSAFGYGVHGGVKIWLTPEVSFFVEPRINFTELEFGGVDADLDEFQTLFGFAFSF